MVCLLAQELNIPEIVSVVHDTEHMNLYRQIGVNTIENPRHLLQSTSIAASSDPLLSTICAWATRQRCSR